MAERIRDLALEAVGAYLAREPDADLAAFERFARLAASGEEPSPMMHRDALLPEDMGPAGFSVLLRAVEVFLGELLRGYLRRRRPTETVSRVLLRERFESERVVQRAAEAARSELPGAQGAVLIEIVRIVITRELYEETPGPARSRDSR